MSVLGWIIVVLVVVTIVIVVSKMLFGGPNNAMGYSPGNCPNMGACDGCDICEGD